MTLMDAPKYDAAGSRRRAQTIYAFLGGFFLLLIAAWLFVGHPVAAPWNWYTYWAGQRSTEQFLKAVEANDLPKAYALWNNDPAWQQNAARYSNYPFDRFQKDWGQNSTDNEYGTISSHEIVVEKLVGSGLIVGSLINGRKSKPLFLIYDRKAKNLGFSPFELSLDK